MSFGLFLSPEERVDMLKHLLDRTLEELGVQITKNQQQRMAALKLEAAFAQRRWHFVYDTAVVGMTALYLGVVLGYYFAHRTAAQA